ncbi:RidA family protein [Desulfolutivibrio sulfoxidireducens]|nr:RidA family protein [Desulfolutivibrio sulfoxidireducens]
MLMKSVSSNEAPAAIGPYSQAVDLGSVIYLSGQIGADPVTGKLVSGFEAQTMQALCNVRAVLAACGLDFDNVPSVDIYLTDMSMFKKLNEVYSEFFPKNKPARLAIEVKGLPAGAEIEIRCVAYRNGACDVVA